MLLVFDIINCSLFLYLIWFIFSIFINDTIELTTLLSQDYRYYSYFDAVLHYADENTCRKLGFDTPTCTVNDFSIYPPWGSIKGRSFVSSGKNIVIDYKGRPVSDHFKFSIVPGTEICHKKCQFSHNYFCRNVISTW